MISEKERLECERIGKLFMEMSEKGTWFEFKTSKGWEKVTNGSPALGSPIDHWRVAEPDPMDELIDDLLKWFINAPSDTAYKEIKAILKKHNVNRNLWQTILLAPREAETSKDTDLLLWSKDWIDEDYCPSGIRDGFWDDEDGWVTAKWNYQQEHWDTENQSEPTHFILKSYLVK